MLANIWNAVGITFGILLIVIMLAIIIIIIQSVFNLGGKTNEKKIHGTGIESNKRD